MANLTHPHYFAPDTVGDKCLHCDKSEKERPHVAIPSAWIPVVATLCHNTVGFRPNDISEYTRFDRQLVGGNVVRALLSAGYIERIGPPGRGRSPALYGLTVRGWAWVEGTPPPTVDQGATPPAVQGSP